MIMRAHHFSAFACAADRTGTGDLRLDREQLENPPSKSNSPRDSRNLRFPTAENSKVPQDQLTFPTP
jgi:hypothetical protein